MTTVNKEKECVESHDHVCPWNDYGIEKKKNDQNFAIKFRFVLLDLKRLNNRKEKNNFWFALFWIWLPSKFLKESLSKYFEKNV